MRSLSIAEDSARPRTGKTSRSSRAPDDRIDSRHKIPATIGHQPDQAQPGDSSTDSIYDSEPPPIFMSSYNPVIASSLLLKIVAGIGIFVASAWLLMHSSVVPYNVRNLLHPVHPFLSLVALSVFLYWTFGFPVITTYWLTRSRLRAVFYPLLLACHAIVAWFLLSYSVSFDRIHKIVGAPILGWHWYWEPAGRFIALFAAISLALTGGTLFAARLSYNRKILTAFIVWIATAAALSPFLYWIVITKAATDNLVELMAGNGTVPAAVLLCIYLTTITFAGALSAAQAQQRLRAFGLRTFLALGLSVPIACLAIYYGTEQHMEKYGKVFSALQFLLSRDRENYAQGFELIVRYCFFHGAITALVFMIQYPFFSGLFSSDKTESANRRAMRSVD
jgi:hypothetical protein